MKIRILYFSLFSPEVDIVEKRSENSCKDNLVRNLTICGTSDAKLLEKKNRLRRYSWIILCPLPFLKYRIYKNLWQRETPFYIKPLGKVE